MSAGALRPKRAVAHAEHLDVSLVVAEITIEEGGLDVLAAASALAMEQSGEHRAHRVYAGADVADGGLRKDRRAVRVAGHVEDAGVSGADKIVARLLGERSALAER